MTVFKIRGKISSGLTSEDTGPDSRKDCLGDLRKYFSRGGTHLLLEFDKSAQNVPSGFDAAGVPFQLLPEGLVAEAMGEEVDCEVEVIGRDLVVKSINLDEPA